MFKVTETGIPGLLVIEVARHVDQRGTFDKLFHREGFARAGLETSFPEEYVSRSHEGVVRGLHFQIPPVDHVKVVTCLEGRIFDAALDLRVGSPTYGRHYTLELDDRLARMLYVPRGLAHGFCAMTPGALVLYRTSTTHSPPHDAGIRWDSAGIGWPAGAALLSDRDKGFPTLSEFKSPFSFHG